MCDYSGDDANAPLRRRGCDYAAKEICRVWKRDTRCRGIIKVACSVSRSCKRPLGSHEKHQTVRQEYSREQKPSNVIGLRRTCHTRWHCLTVNFCDGQSFIPSLEFSGPLMRKLGISSRICLEYRTAGSVIARPKSKVQSPRSKVQGPKPKGES